MQQLDVETNNTFFHTSKPKLQGIKIKKKKP